MFLFLISSLIILFYILSLKYFVKNRINSHSYKNYYALYIIILTLIPTILVFMFGNHFINLYIKNIVLYHPNLSLEQKNISTYKSILVLAKQISDGVSFENIKIFSPIPKNILYDLSTLYLKINFQLNLVLYSFTTLVFVSIFLILIHKINLNHNFHKKIENIIKIVLAFFASIAIATTGAILIALLFETIEFFKHIPVLNFLFGIKWSPAQVEIDPNNSFGILPLISGTLLISFISVFVAIIIGVSCAIYMSEYMSPKLRNIIKPLLEILAGIPSIVYGFFAAITFSPAIVSLFKNIFDMNISNENALSASIVMGIMILPFISSISDDVLKSLPRSIREGAIGIGSMKNEMIIKILIPAAIPGIMGGILLAISRAIGETMIVVMASSLSANLTLNPLQPVTTITTQIAMLVQGDQEFNSPTTLSAFALAFVLLILTLILNIIAIKIVNNYKAKYGK